MISQKKKRKEVLCQSSFQRISDGRCVAGNAHEGRKDKNLHIKKNKCHGSKQIVLQSLYHSHHDNCVGSP